MEEMNEKQVEEILYKLGLPLVKFAREFLSKEHVINIDWKSITLYFKERDLTLDDEVKQNKAVHKQLSVEFFIFGSDNMPDWFSNGLTDYDTVRFVKSIESGSSTYKILTYDDTWKECHYGDVVVLDEYGYMDVFKRQDFEKYYQIV